MPSKSRRSAVAGPAYVPANSSRRGPVPNGKALGLLDRPIDSDSHRDEVPSPGSADASPNEAQSHNGQAVGVNGAVNGHSVTNGVSAPPRFAKTEVIENPPTSGWHTAEVRLPRSHLQPASSHSLRQITARRSRSGMWTTLALVMLAAALTVALLMLVGNSGQNHAEARASVLSAAETATAAVADSVSILDSLRAESSFTPDLVVSISALGDASRGLVESITALPSNDSSLVELRMQATGLAGRVSRLGETFGAAFSYRGQVGPLMTLPALNDPLNIAHLSDNATLLADWQFQLEQAALTPPSQPRLQQNHEALGAILPYLAVHRQVYVDAVGNGQPEQATAALSQINSLLSALRQDFARAYDEITEISQAEIRSLSADLQVLAKGTAST